MNDKSRKRVMDAIAHREPDRLPADLWAEPEVKEKLLKYYVTSDWNHVLDILEIDVRLVEHVAPPLIYEGDVRCNQWGECWRKTDGGWNHTKGKLFNAQTIEELENYNWPSCDDLDYSTLREQIDRVPGRAILYGFSDVWERAALVVGMENMYVQMAENPPFVHYIVRKFTDYYKEDWRRALAAAGDKIDIMIQLSDLGTQIAPLISPEMFRTYIKPCVKELFDVAKAAGKACMFHACGCSAVFIPDLIETGMDILNPVQVSAADMEPEILKKRFGEKITFHGGIDEQKLLCSAGPAEVQAKVRETAQILGKNGGYILCSTHLLQDDIPIKNIVAMYDVSLR